MPLLKVSIDEPDTRSTGTFKTLFRTSVEYTENPNIEEILSTFKFLYPGKSLFIHLTFIL